VSFRDESQVPLPASVLTESESKHVDGNEVDKSTFTANNSSYNVEEPTRPTTVDDEERATHVGAIAPAALTKEAIIEDR